VYRLKPDDPLSAANIAQKLQNEFVIIVIDIDNFVVEVLQLGY